MRFGHLQLVPVSGWTNSVFLTPKIEIKAHQIIYIWMTPKKVMFASKLDILQKYSKNKKIIKLSYTILEIFPWFSSRCKNFGVF